MDIVDDLRVHLDYLSRTVLLQVRQTYAGQTYAGPDEDGNRRQADNHACEPDRQAGTRRRFPFARR